MSSFVDAQKDGVHYFGAFRTFNQAAKASLEAQKAGATSVHWGHGGVTSSGHVEFHPLSELTGVPK